MGRHDAPARAAAAENTAGPDTASVDSDLAIADQPSAPEPTDGASTDGGGEASPDEAGPRKRRRPRPNRSVLVSLVALLIIGASAAAVGYMVPFDKKAAAERERAAAFAAAARQSTIDLLSLNGETTRADVQRVIDGTTGSLLAGILINSEDLIKMMEQAKVSTKVTVESAAVDTMTDNSAVVLVAARTAVSNSDEPEAAPQLLRIVMDLQRIDGQPKVAKVSLVP